MASGLQQNYGIATGWTAGICGALVFFALVGGIKRIGEITSKLLPAMAIWYCVSAIVVLAFSGTAVFESLALIVTSAFKPAAAAGGFTGAALIAVMRNGISRGLFSNEAGGGAAPIAHAAAKTNSPVNEGLVASLGPLIDTLIICTLTGLVIITTGAWQSGIEGVGKTIQGLQNGHQENQT